MSNVPAQVAPSTVKPLHFALGVALTAVTIFVAAWAASKGWTKGKN